MRRRGRRVLYRQIDVDNIPNPSEDDDFFIRNENAFWITNDLFKNIGRSRICVVREHYLDLFSITRTRDAKDVYSTPLHIAAAKNKHLHTVENLLKNQKIDKNARNRYGETVMLLALKENVDESIINKLMEYGCDCTIGCFRGVTPLHVAALDNKVDLMHKFIERGADVNTVSNIGITALHLAVLTSQYEAVCELLNYNANPTLITTLEFTPLMLALGFQNIDIRICELLCSYDVNTTTRIGNAIYCAVRAQHCLAEKLILEGADVNYIGNIHGTKTSCLLEAIYLNSKHLFDLIWPRFDQNLFQKKLTDFLEYFVDSCGLKGSDLVDCLKSILTSTHGSLLIKNYFQKRKQSFLQSFFENLDQYQLTSDNCYEIISALPIVFYDDISYIYKKSTFDKELVNLLKSYKYELMSQKNQNRGSNIYIDYICYNTVKTDPYNLKEILHFLKYCTPDISFRNHFYTTFSGVAASTDVKLDRLIALYKLCEEMFAKRSIASLQELSRDKLRKILFTSKEKPYKAISDLPIPEVFKDILFLKMPIYC